MKFQVPQFIETEVKLVGPFTLKQFLWLTFGAVLIYVLYLAVQRVVFFILAIPIGALFGSLAFVTVNGAPLFNYISYAISFALNPKKYVYKKFEAPANYTNFSSIELRDGNNNIVNK